MINRRVDVAGQRVGETQEYVSLSERWGNFGAPGERSERRPRITHLKPFHAFLEALDGFTRKVEDRRTLPSEGMSAQLAINGNGVCHYAVSRATCKPVLKSPAAAPLCVVSGFSTNS